MTLNMVYDVWWVTLKLYMIECVNYSNKYERYYGPGRMCVTVLAVAKNLKANCHQKMPNLTYLALRNAKWQPSLHACIRARPTYGYTPYAATTRDVMHSSNTGKDRIYCIIEEIKRNNKLRGKM